MLGWWSLWGACGDPTAPRDERGDEGRGTPTAAEGAPLRRAPWLPLLPLVASYRRGEVVVRAPWPDAPEVGISLVAWGDPGAPTPVDPVPWTVVDGRTTWRRGGLSEWWARGPGGLEQGFVLDEPPAGPVVLELALRGARALVDPDGSGATWQVDGGGALRYESLAAWDELGRSLPAHLEATPAGLRLWVDAAGAVGAVTVDPLLPGAAWGPEGDQVSAEFGISVASAGDVNGDGYDDVIVGAHRWDAPGLADAGAVFVYHGSATGPSAVPAWTREGTAAALYFGGSVASAGDVNGDPSRA